MAFEDLVKRVKEQLKARSVAEGSTPASEMYADQKERQKRELYEQQKRDEEEKRSADRAEKERETSQQRKQDRHDEFKRERDEQKRKRLEREQEEWNRKQIAKYRDEEYQREQERVINERKVKPITISSAAVDISSSFRRGLVGLTSEEKEVKKHNREVEGINYRFKRGEITAAERDVELRKSQSALEQKRFEFRAGFRENKYEGGGILESLRPVAGSMMQPSFKRSNKQPIRSGGGIDFSRPTLNYGRGGFGSTIDFSRASIDFSGVLGGPRKRKRK